MIIDLRFSGISRRELRRNWLHSKYCKATLQILLLGYEHNFMYVSAALSKQQRLEFFYMS